MNNIANIIKFKLQQKQWSVAELSRNAEVPIKTLQNILYAGKINVTIQTALKLADVFDCSLDELIDRSQIINHSKQSKEDDVFNQKLFQKCVNAVNNYLKSYNISKDKNQIIEIINHIYDLYFLKLKNNLYFENIDYADIEKIINLNDD